MDSVGVMLFLICVVWGAVVIWLKTNHPEVADRLQGNLRKGNQQYQNLMGKAGKTAGRAAVRGGFSLLKRMLK